MDSYIVTTLLLSQHKRKRERESLIKEQWQMGKMRGLIVLREDVKREVK